MDDQERLVRTINEKMLPHLPEQAWHSTVAIVVPCGTSVHQFGTGVLLGVADDSFVVTAGHVVKQAAKDGKTLGISSAVDSIVAVPGDWVCSSETQKGRSGDPFDVAVHRLPPSTVSRLDGKVFLRLDDIEFGRQPPAAVYVVSGFPAVWSSPSASVSDRLRLKPFQYTTLRYDGPTDALEGYEPCLHLLLGADLESSSTEHGSRASFQNLHGDNVPFPQGLGGVSGCSVWRIGDLTTPIDEWGRERSRIVAVQTGVYPQKRLIKATRWVAVSTLLHNAFPELRPAMHLWRAP